MKQNLAIFGLIALLTACGGGGGGSSTGGGYTPPTITTANTNLPYYMPMANGNYWTFATGGKMQDMGAGQLQCSCPGNGLTMERIGLYAPGASVISSSFFFTKTTPAGGTTFTSIIGVENDANSNNITIASSAQYPGGVPIMDDSPRQNESWNDGAGSISTIMAVGGTLMLANNSQVVGIATDQLTGNFSTITWGFAHGVGLTSIAVGNQATTLSSFYVNTASSTAITRKPELLKRFGAVRTGDVRALVHSALKRLF